uniref:Uncharacterized protein n=1 Tax=Triticum aestivum TaxID=4565 RepID=A0A077RXS5_WHEAT|nr:unnamed protein product [Triticum aestivum]
MAAAAFSIRFVWGRRAVSSPTKKRSISDLFAAAPPLIVPPAGDAGCKEQTEVDGDEALCAIARRAKEEKKRKRKLQEEEAGQKEETAVAAAPESSGGWEPEGNFAASKAARAGGSGGQIPSPASPLLVLPQPPPLKATSRVGAPWRAPLARVGRQAGSAGGGSGVAAHGRGRSGVAELGRGVAAEALAHGFGLRAAPGRVLEAATRLGHGGAGEGTRGGHGAASPPKRCCFGSGRV